MTWHTVAETSKILNLSPSIIYRLCGSRRLAHRRVGSVPGRGRIEISDEGIAVFLKACEMAAVAGANNPVGSDRGDATQEKRGRPRMTRRESKRMTELTTQRPDGKPFRFLK